MDYLIFFALFILPGLLFIIFGKPLGRMAARNVRWLHRSDAGDSYYSKYYRIEYIGFGLVLIGVSLYYLFFRS